MTARAALPRLVLLLVIAGAAVWLAFHRDQLDPVLLERTVRDLGPWAPFIHVMLFAAGTVLFVPGAIFGLAGGALFGPLWGTLLNLAGATLGATASFLIARYVAADWVRSKVGRRLQRLAAGVEAEGWRFVAFVRLVPLFPFNLLNYALGLTQISFTHYVLASLVCMAPGTLAYAWLGYAGREALADNRSAISYGLIALALLATVALLPRLIRRLGGDRGLKWIEVEQLASWLKDGAKVIVIDVRGPEEFTGPLGCLPYALNVPLGTLRARLTEIKMPEERPIILVCHTDKRSVQAAVILLEAGFQDVRVLRGGMERWNSRQAD